MANGLLAAGAGASQGLETLLTRMMTEARLKQMGDAELETSRHNRATEANTGAQIAATYGLRDATLNETKAKDAQAATDREDAQTVRRIGLRPIGAPVPPSEFAGEMKSRIPMGNYSFGSPGEVPTIPPNGEMPKLPGMISWKGTQDQITKADALDKKTAPTGPVVETKGGLVRVNPDNTTTPITDGATGADGIQKFHAPPSPLLVQTATGPQLADKTSGVAKPVTDQKGTPLPPAESASERDKAQSRARARKTLDSLDSDIEQAKGILGPGVGQLGNFETWVGSTNPILSRIGTRMLAAKMQVDAGIGGMRGAASPGLLARWDHLLSLQTSPDSLKEVVQVMREMVGDDPATPATGTTDKPKKSAADYLKEAGYGR